MSHLKQILIPEKSPRRVGVVESDRRSKTRSVRIDRLVKHPKYGKFVRRSRLLHVHDENNESHVGDRVEVAACRRLSKSKNWVLTRVIESGAGRIEHTVEAGV